MPVEIYFDVYLRQQSYLKAYVAPTKFQVDHLHKLFFPLKHYPQMQYGGPLGERSEYVRGSQDNYFQLIFFSIHNNGRNLLIHKY